LGNELGPLLALFENLLPHDGHHHPSVGHVCIRGQDPKTAAAAGTSSTTVLELTLWQLRKGCEITTPHFESVIECSALLRDVGPTE
jgi:hypothetical protein